jgi:hypothetical protein
MSETQCGYILKMLKHWQDERFDEVDVSTDTAKNFLQYIREGMKNTVWLGGCNSWYLDKDGDPILWPYTWEKWVKEMAEPNLADFELRSFAKPDKLEDAA